MVGANQKEWFDRLHQDYPNLCVALEWFLQDAGVEQAARLAVAAIDLPTLYDDLALEMG